MEVATNTVAVNDRLSMKKPAHRIRRLSLLALLLALAGCATLQEEIQPPGVRLVGVEVKEAGLLTQRYGVTRTTLAALRHVSGADPN